MSDTPWRTRQDDIDQIKREEHLVTAALASAQATKDAARWAKVAAIGAVVAAVGTVAGALIMYLKP
jgi:hypothetical protein